MVLLWELLSRADTAVLPRQDVPPPSTIVKALYEEAQRAAYWGAVGQTLKGIAIGLGIALLTAVPLGIVIGSSRPLFRSVRALIELLRPIPSLTLLPLAILVVGLGFQLKLFFVVLAAFWPLLIQTLYGVQDVDPVARDMARAYGLGPLASFIRITLPSAMPFIATGLRIAAVIALNVGIGIELLVGTTHGIGEQLYHTQTAGRIPAMYAYVVTAAILGLLLNVGLRRIERRVLHWHPSQREVVTP